MDKNGFKTDFVEWLYGGFELNNVDKRMERYTGDDYLEERQYRLEERRQIYEEMIEKEKTTRMEFDEKYSLAQK